MELINLEANAVNAEQMSSYMRSKFPFKGVKTPERKKATRPLLKESKAWDESKLLTVIQEYYALKEREYQYIAIDLALYHVKTLSWDAFQQVMAYVAQKAWWDSVDAWRKVITLWWIKHPEHQKEVFDYFLNSDDFWERRIAITIQLMLKEQTNTLLLEQAILQDRLTDEFFIQKAIGWALREYAKTDEDYVRDFVSRHELTPLAYREAIKHINKKVGY